MPPGRHRPHLVCAGIDKGPCQVVEMLGRDRQGLLASIMTCLHEHQCEVWSASTWTSKDRATFVLGVNDVRYPLTVTANWMRLHSVLFEIMGGSEESSVVKLESVVRLSHLPTTILTSHNPDCRVFLHTCKDDVSCSLYAACALISLRLRCQCLLC